MITTTTLTPPVAGISRRLPPPPNSAGGSTSNFFSSSKPKASFHAVLESKPAIYDRRSENLYQVLRIGRNATTTEIKTAYRSLAKVYHPDSSEFDVAGEYGDFIEIRKAYVTLSDPEAREMYDLKWRRRSGLLYSVVGKRPVVYAGGGRRWETDQCW